MRTTGKLGCLLGVAAILTLSISAEAKLSTNKLVTNKLVLNQSSALRLASSLKK
jgi:hypothetical protein